MLKRSSSTAGYIILNSCLIEVQLGYTVHYICLIEVQLEYTVLYLILVLSKFSYDIVQSKFSLNTLNRCSIKVHERYTLQIFNQSSARI